MRKQKWRKHTIKCSLWQIKKVIYADLEHVKQERAKKGECHDIEDSEMLLYHVVRFSLLVHHLA